MARKKLWAYHTGKYHARVRVYESRPGGVLHAEIGRKRQSLGHRDREKAKAWADAMSARKVLKQDITEEHIPRVDYVISLYLEHRSPRHTAIEQQRDERCAELWTRVLGAETDLTEISLEAWDSFAENRLSGAIDPRGNPKAKRHKVRARTVGSDQEWLRGVILWAMKRKIGAGKRLMSENPLTVDGFKIMAERNPRRPVATTDRYEKTRAVSDQIMMDIRVNGRRFTTRSYLSELLDIINGTGRRLGSILQLRFNDLRLDVGPHGSIHWRWEADKKDKEWNVPINSTVRAAINRITRERPAIGDAFLFPSPRNPRCPISKDLASGWLERAEVLAEIGKLDGSLFHAYRRGWATSRKGLPDVDVAKAGGWSDLTSLKTAYQQPDVDTLYKVVSEPAEIRESNG